MKEKFNLIRGGSWGSYSGDCRSAYRYGGGPENRGDCRGFRAVCTPRSSTKGAKRS
jgi:formylglycine-generating enzyme required for sulfatase activity